MIRRMTETEGIALLVRAADFASRLHRHQRRKGTDAEGREIPYVLHPLGVARILLDEAGVHDPVILAAAMLHDTIEDTAATAAELRALFGAEVTELVLAVTDDKSLPKAERKREQIRHAAELPRGARFVKLADKLSNLRDLAERTPPGWSVERVRGYFVWAHAVVTALGDVHAGLQRELGALFAPRVPADAAERAQLLEAYLASFGSAR